MTTKIYKYLGDGFSFIPGVPTRDLSEADFKALSPELRDDCLKSGLYVAEVTKKSVSVTEEADNG